MKDYRKRINRKPVTIAVLGNENHRRILGTFREPLNSEQTLSKDTLRHKSHLPADPGESFFRGPPTMVVFLTDSVSYHPNQTSGEFSRQSLVVLVKGEAAPRARMA